jgi:hypothetical protein
MPYDYNRRAIKAAQDLPQPVAAEIPDFAEFWRPKMRNRSAASNNLVAFHAPWCAWHALRYFNLSCEIEYGVPGPSQHSPHFQYRVLDAE